MIVDEVIKAGSLGHGTAVPGDFDLDLVIYSQSKSAGICIYALLLQVLRCTYMVVVVADTHS